MVSEPQKRLQLILAAEKHTAECTRGSCPCKQPPTSYLKSSEEQLRYVLEKHKTVPVIEWDELPEPEKDTLKVIMIE